MTIDDYSFGRMTIDGRVFTSDLVISPGGRISTGWWRRRGHVVGMADLGLILAALPAALVIGTGASGMMRPEPALSGELADLGVHLVIAPTAEAVRRFNALPHDTRAGAFHLTC